VLGALLLGVIVLFVSCSIGGGDDKNNNQRGQGAATQSPLPVPSTPDETPSFSDAKPNGGPSLPAPGDIDSNQPSLGDGTDDGSGSGLPATPPADGTNQNAAAITGDTCADVEMSVTPIPAAASVKRGVPVNIRLKIKNIGTRTCSRDVGAGPQELYIDQGARKYWSSDTCSTAGGSDVVKFTPGMEREYNATWNGRQSSKCTAGASAGPAPPPGVYEIRGRLGSKISNPVSLTIAA
jgi:hypothetical protein